GETKTIAILDFSNNSLIDKEKYAALSSGLAEIMITELSKVQSLQLVERQKINAIIQEMQLSQSGLISEAAGVQVGKLLGAHYLVFGSYMVSFGEKIRIDLRIVEVETGVTIKAEEVTDKVSKVFDSIKKLNEKITKDLNVKLTASEKDALSKGDVSLEVIQYFSTGLELEKAGKLNEAKKMYQKALAKDGNFKPAKKRLGELGK
ncbi:MAG: CsgG/HfaB family protein, partial [candidate division KSB1 bacterium]|nr:CsgG/HfaB family protein [candidate division KSB1 bacterium]